MNCWIEYQVSDDLRHQLSSLSCTFPTDGLLLSRGDVNYGQLGRPCKGIESKQFGLVDLKGVTNVAANAAHALAMTQQEVSKSYVTSGSILYITECMLGFQMNEKNNIHTVKPVCNDHLYNKLHYLQGWVQIRICICIQIRKYLYLYLYLKNTKLACLYLYLYLYLNDVCERICKRFFKYSSNFIRISAELNISSVACSVLPLTNWIMTHTHCNVKFPITAWIYNTNDWDELLTMALFKFVPPDLCLL